MASDPGGNAIAMQLLLLVLLTLVNAFFAGAEMAIVSVNKNKIKMLAEKGNKKARLIEGLFDDSTKFLSTIQVAITFAGFFSSASAATGISQVLGGWDGAVRHPVQLHDCGRAGYDYSVLLHVSLRRACAQTDRAAKGGAVQFDVRPADPGHFARTLAVYQAAFLVNQRLLAVVGDEDGES